MPNAQSHSRGSLATWMGIPVSLRITAGETRTSLLCTIIGESEATVRVRIGDQWDVDIYKEMILAVDNFPCEGMDLPSQDCEEPNAVNAGCPGGRGGNGGY